MKKTIDLSDLYENAGLTDGTVSGGVSSQKVPVEIQRASRTPMKSESSKGSVLVKGAGLLISAPAEVALGAIEAVASCVTCFFTCWRDVQIERERTKQYKYMAKMYIKQQKEQTKRIAIQEEQATKRYEMQVIAEMEKSRQETEVVRIQVEKDLKMIENDHAVQMKILETLQKSVNQCGEHYFELLGEYKENGYSDPNIKDALNQLGAQYNSALAKVTEFGYAISSK